MEIKNRFRDKVEVIDNGIVEPNTTLKEKVNIEESVLIALY